MPYKQKGWSPFTFEEITKKAVVVRGKPIKREYKFQDYQIYPAEYSKDQRPSHIKRKDYKPQSQSKVYNRHYGNNFGGFRPQTTQWWKTDVTPQSKGGTGRNWWQESEEYKPQSQRKK